MKNIIVIPLLLFVAFGFGQEQKTCNIGIIADFQSLKTQPALEQLQNEIKSVVGEDAIIKFPLESRLVNNYDTQKATAIYNQLLNNDTDIILAFGPVTSKLLEKQTSYPKPVILFGAINRDFSNLDFSKETSGIPNFTYLIDSQSYLEDFKKLKELRRANIKYEVDLYKTKAKKAESEQKESESEVLKWRISIILGIVLILTSLTFLISSYRNNLQKKKLNNDLIDKNKELISAKETAEQVSTLKSQFISTVSHELRTPLYGVIGLTSLLMENPDDKEAHEYLESLKFSGDYLLALINDVLQLSKIETNEVSIG